MAPMLSGIKEVDKEIKILNNNINNNKKKLLQLRSFVEKNFRYVGSNFSNEAREIYYDKKNKKAIYGTATSDERKELKEEGIDLVSIPWVSKDN